MAAGPIYLSSQSLERIRELARTGRASDDALVVPYGEGKFYLATRQSRVAAFLPTFLNRLLKLTVHDGHEKAGRAFEVFIKAVEESRREAGIASSQNQPEELLSGKHRLTLGYAATIIEELKTNKKESLRQEASMKGKYGREIGKILGNAGLPYPGKFMAEEYLPNFRHQRTRSLRYFDPYEEILQEVFRPDRPEPITKKDELVYELRLAKMLATARGVGLFPLATGTATGKRGMANTIKQTAKLAAYQTFEPDAADGKELAKLLTRRGTSADKNTMEGWKAVIKIGEEVAELS